MGYIIAGTIVVAAAIMMITYRKIIAPLERSGDVDPMGRDRDD